MSGMSSVRKLASLAVFALLLSAGAVSVYSAQEQFKAPSWVGIYTTAGKVGLKWTAVTGASRYRVFRTIITGKGYELVAATTDVSYIDADARPGETYYYALKAVDAEGKESPFSDERYIKLPVTGGGVPVAPPEWVGALLDDKRIKLAWLPSPSSNALAYNVYRSKVKDGGFQLVGSTQDPNFTDGDVREGETYYYALTTLDKEFKETKYSETREVAYVLEKEAGAEKAGPKGEAAGFAPPEKIIVKPTKIIGYITRGKDDQPLSSPTDIALLPDGKILVTNTGTATIFVYSKNGEYVKSIGGYGTGEGRFEKLLGVYVDTAGLIYAADAYTGKLQKFDAAGHLMMSKNMVEDAKKIAEDLGLKAPVTTFGIVRVVVSPAGRIYVVDNLNDCVEVYSPTGTYIKTFGGMGVEDGKFQKPTFATFNKDGDLYVADCINARVQVFDKDGVYKWKFGGYGNVVGTFSRPKGIYIGADDRIYIADSMANVVQVFDNDGRFLFLLGDERGRQMDLGTPNGIVMDDKRRIYMVEKLINRVQIRQVGEQ